MRINIGTRNKNNKEEVTLINEQIKATECRLIGEDGDQIGIIDVSEALKIAYDSGYDLVEISPNSSPVVCRIMDYGKFKYEKQKKQKENKKNAKKQQTKEMKFRCGIGIGDYNTKKKHISKFLADGNNVKITIMFKGREMSHPEIGVEILDKLVAELEDEACVLQKPSLEGRNMTMVISPANEH